MRLRNLISCAFVSIALAACGGGGSGYSSPQPNGEAENSSNENPNIKEDAPDDVSFGSTAFGNSTFE
jgi:hypothetical protein